MRLFLKSVFGKQFLESITLLYCTLLWLISLLLLSRFVKDEEEKIKKNRNAGKQEVKLSYAGDDTLPLSSLLGLVLFSSYCVLGTSSTTACAVSYYYYHR